MKEYDILEPKVPRQTYPELNVIPPSMADCLKRRTFFKDNWAPYVPGPPDFRVLTPTSHRSWVSEPIEGAVA